MVKKLALMGSILLSIGGVFFSLLMNNVLSGGMPLNKFLGYTSARYITTTAFFVPVALYVMVFGIFFIFLSSVSSKKTWMKIGGILSAFSYVLYYLLWAFTFQTNGTQYSMAFTAPHFIVGIVTVIGAVLYFIGTLHYRYNNKLGLITGGAILILTIFSNFIINIILLSNTSTVVGIYTQTSILNTYVLTQILLINVIMIHGWLYTFSKKGRLGAKEASADEMAIGGTNSAFASYVDPSSAGSSYSGSSYSGGNTYQPSSGDGFAAYSPDEGSGKKSKKKKAKKSKSSDGGGDDAFSFDF